MKTVDVRDGHVANDRKQYRFNDSNDVIFAGEGGLLLLKEKGPKPCKLLSSSEGAHYLCRAILSAAKDAGYKFKPEDVFYEVDGGDTQRDVGPPNHGDVVKIKEGEVINSQTGAKLQGYAIWTDEQQPLCDPKYVVVGLGNDCMGHSFFVRKDQVEVVMREDHE